MSRHFFTLSKSNETFSVIVPNSFPFLAESNMWAACSKALVGTQAQLGHSPPISPFSKIATFLPKLAAVCAPTLPPAPLPMIIKSKSYFFLKNM